MPIRHSHVNKKRPRIDWAAVGQRVRELRADVTQVQFARRLGISQGFLSHVERGDREIGLELLLRISDEFGKSLDWLIKGDK